MYCNVWSVYVNHLLSLVQVIGRPSLLWQRRVCLWKVWMSTGEILVWLGLSLDMLNKHCWSGLPQLTLIHMYVLVMAAYLIARAPMDQCASAMTVLWLVMASSAIEKVNPMVLIYIHIWLSPTAFCCNAPATPIYTLSCTYCILSIHVQPFLSTYRTIKYVPLPVHRFQL